MQRKISTVVLLTLLFVLSTTSQIALADSHTDEIFKVNYGDYKDKSVYYHLDYIDPTELEDEEWYDKFRVFKNLTEGVVGFFYNILHQIFVVFPFTLIKAFTNAMIWIFNKTYEVNFVDTIVSEIASSIQNIAGISGNNFKSTGLFGGLLGIVCLIIAIYALYQLIVNRASITAFSGLLKSLTALVLALVFFSNYSTIISGLNKLSVEASGLIVSGSITVNDKGNISNDTALDQMNSALWDVFVHKPYLMLQYGTMDEEEIGKDRILELLEEKPNSEERHNLVQEEVNDRGNEMMTRVKIFERWVILWITAFGNMFNSIPVILLSFALIFFQFWFTAMAMIAPFIFIWSAFPNQFGVLTRYLLELITPLVLKMAVAVIALIVFSITGILTNVVMNTLNTNGILALIFLMFIEGILFFTLFLLRNRIFNIFSAGSKQLSMIRGNMSSAFTQPIKKGVQTVSTGVGTVAGAMSGGSQGAMTGAHIGSTVGQFLTGDKGIGEAGRDVALASSLYASLKDRHDNSTNGAIDDTSTINDSIENTNEIEETADDNSIDENTTEKLNSTEINTSSDTTNEKTDNENAYENLESLEDETTDKGQTDIVHSDTTNEKADNENIYENLESLEDETTDKGQTDIVHSDTTNEKADNENTYENLGSLENETADKGQTDIVHSNTTNEKADNENTYKNLKSLHERESSIISSPNNSSPKNNSNNSFDDLSSLKDNLNQSKSVLKGSTNETALENLDLKPKNNAIIKSEFTNIPEVIDMNQDKGGYHEVNAENKFDLDDFIDNQTLDNDINSK
jgi:hypothetical protein